MPDTATEQTLSGKLAASTVSVVPARIPSPLYRNSTSGARLFTVVCVADRVTKPAIELGAVQDDLLRILRFDGAQWDREATGVLDVDYKNSPTALAKPGERRRAAFSGDARFSRDGRSGGG